MATTQVNPTSELKFRVRAFDLSKFSKVSLEGTTQFVPPVDLNSALSAYADRQDDLFRLLVKVMKKDAISVAKSATLAEHPNLIGSAKIINTFVAAFKQIPPFSKMLVMDSNGKPTTESRKTQKAAIFAKIAKDSDLVAQIREAALTADEDEDEDEGEEDDS